VALDIGRRRAAAVGEPEPQPAGFEEVYAAERLAITRLSFLLVGSQAVGEELAQEAFLRLYQRFDEVENPAGFLRTAVVRLSLSWQSRHRMERERLALVGVPPPTDAPEIDETWDALHRLRPERRMVLVLRFYEQMQYEAIATVVGCSAATARSRARRALSDLRRELR
jgi:RNA polymerase sigma factor (sigma-70 family)